MIPVYFPYTYVSRPVAEAVSACFGRFRVYQPLSDILPPSMQVLMDEGIIDIRIPVDGGNREVIRAAQNYLDWANSHAESSGRHIASLKTLKASAPLLDDALSSLIVADVKKQVNAEPASTSPDLILASRIFLYFAQEFDRQSTELDHGLAELSRKNQALMKDLKMEDDSLATEFEQTSVSTPAENSDHMIVRRLAAWSQILLRDREPGTLFVTNSSAVIDQVSEVTSTLQEILTFDTIPRETAAPVAFATWQEDLFAYLSDMVENKWDPASEKPAPEFDIPDAENTVSLKIYLVPDQNAPKFFCGAAGIKRGEDNLPATDSAPKNILLALVEA